MKPFRQHRRPMLWRPGRVLRPLQGKSRPAVAMEIFVFDLMALEGPLWSD
jgi:hypothetical protein